MDKPRNEETAKSSRDGEFGLAACKAAQTCWTVAGSATVDQGFAE